VGRQFIDATLDPCHVWASDATVCPRIPHLLLLTAGLDRDVVRRDHIDGAAVALQHHASAKQDCQVPGTNEIYKDPKSRRGGDCGKDKLGTSRYGYRCSESGSMPSAARWRADWRLVLRRVGSAPEERRVRTVSVWPCWDDTISGVRPLEFGELMSSRAAVVV